MELYRIYIDKGANHVEHGCAPLYHDDSAQSAEDARLLMRAAFFDCMKQTFDSACSVIQCWSS